MRDDFILCFSWLFVATILFTSAAQSEEYFDQPVVSAVSSGGQKLVDLSAHLSKLSERPEIESFLKTRMDKLPILQAFDLNQPVAGFLFFPVEGLQPVPLIIVPVKDFDAIRTAVENKFHLTIEATNDPEYWTIPGKKNVIQLRLIQGFAAISEDRYLLERCDEEFLLQMKSRAQQFDLSVRILPQAVPAPLRDVALFKIKANLNKDLKRKSNQSDEEFQLQHKIGQLILAGLTHVVQETEELSVGLSLNDNFIVNAEWKAMNHSTLASIFEKLPCSTNAFPRESDSAATLQSALLLPEPLRDVLQSFVSLARKNVGTEMGQDLEPGSRNPVGQVFDTFAATIEHGELNTNIEFVPVHDHFALIAAISLQQPAGLETSLRAVLPYVVSDKNVKSVEVDVIADDKLRIHRLTGKDTKQEDRNLYGDELAMYVGTDSKAGWFAMGSPDTLSLLANRSKQDVLPSTALAELHFALHPWIQLATRQEKQDEFLKFLQTAFPENEQDEIHLILQQQTQTLILQGEIESGYQKLGGIILTELLKRRQPSKSGKE